MVGNRVGKPLPPLGDTRRDCPSNAPDVDDIGSNTRLASRASAYAAASARSTDREHVLAVILLRSRRRRYLRWSGHLLEHVFASIATA